MKVINVVSEYYKKKNEKLPKSVRYLIVGLNLHDKNYTTLSEDFDLDPEDEEEVVKFILNPDNSFDLGVYGYGSLKIPTKRFVLENGVVVDEGNYELKLK